MNKQTKGTPARWQKNRPLFAAIEVTGGFATAVLFALLGLKRCVSGKVDGVGDGEWVFPAPGKGENCHQIGEPGAGDSYLLIDHAPRWREPGQRAPLIHDQQV